MAHGRRAHVAAGAAQGAAGGDKGGKWRGRRQATAWATGRLAEHKLHCCRGEEQRQQPTEQGSGSSSLTGVDEDEA
uniref:Uncharacterized protein n=1 Tax=Leersia perrieri TaxID=77586 RepID=A0A0D9WQL1_9ORYZ